MTYAQLRLGVRAHIAQEHRYAHVVRVARLAETLARMHDESTQRARLAGMLHDLARLYPAAKLLEECERRALSIDAFERANPTVLHARLGAELARELFGVNDSAVLSAIRKHTVADASMSRLDAIVYLADALEPGRDYPERAEFLAIAMRDLDAAMRAVLNSSVTCLRSRGAMLAPQTLAAIQTYEERSLPPTLIEIAREAAEDKKAEDVVIVPLEGRTLIADYFLIATGRSKVQTRGIADEITERARAAGFPVARREGYSDGGWILLDFGTVVAHIFTPEQRDFYGLERLWGKSEERARAASE